MDSTAAGNAAVAGFNGTFNEQGSGEISEDLGSREDESLEAGSRDLEKLGSIPWHGGYP